MILDKEPYVNASELSYLKKLGFVGANTTEYFDLPDYTDGAVYLVSCANSYAAGDVAIVQTTSSGNTSVVTHLKESSYVRIAARSSTATQIKVTNTDASCTVYAIKIAG